MGAQAVNMNVAGDFNTAVGMDALLHSTADGNTAVGASARHGVTTGVLHRVAAFVFAVTLTNP